MPLTFTRWMCAALLSALGAAGATPVLPSPSVAAQAVREALAPAPAAPVRNVPAVRAPQLVQRAVRPVQTVQTPAARPTPAQASRPVTAPVARPAPVQVARPVQPPAVRPVPGQPAPVQPAPVQPVRAVQPPAARRAAVQPARPVQAPAARAPRTQPAQAQTAQARALNIQRAQAEVARSTVRTGRSAIVRATAYNSMAGQTDATPFITATGTRTRPGVVALSRDMLRAFPYGTRITIEDLSGRSGNLFRGRVFIVEDTMAARKTGSLDVWMSSYGDAVRFGARQVRITAVR